MRSLELAQSAQSRSAELMKVLTAEEPSSEGELLAVAACEQKSTSWGSSHESKEGTLLEVGDVRLRQDPSIADVLRSLVRKR